MWTTTDGYVLHLPRTVLRRLAAESGASEHEVMAELERGAGRARRIGSLQARKMARAYPLFRARSGRGSFDIVTRPIKGARPIPGPHGLRMPHSIVGVSGGFADRDDDPDVPGGDVDPLLPMRRRTAPGAGRWRGPFPLPAAARLAGGGVYVVEDEAGQPVYVGQTASFARRMTYLAGRFPRHGVRVMPLARPPADVLRAVGDAVARAARGAPAPAPGLLPPGNAYGASLPARQANLLVERTVRAVRAVPRRSGP